MADHSRQITALKELYSLYKSIGPNSSREIDPNMPPVEIGKCKERLAQPYKEFSREVDAARRELLATGFDVPDSWLRVQVIPEVSTHSRPVIMSIVGASTSPGAGRVSPPPDAGPKWFRPGDPVPAELPTGRMRFEFTIPSAERKRLEGILSEMEVALMRLEAGAAHDAKGKAGARAGMGAANGRRKHRQRNDNQKLTAKELEATQAFAECESNYVRTANMLGLSRSATKERIQRAYKKLGQQVPKVTAKSKTLTIPTDQRGGESVSKDGRFG